MTTAHCQSERLLPTLNYYQSYYTTSIDSTTKKEQRRNYHSSQSGTRRKTTAAATTAATASKRFLSSTPSSSSSSNDKERKSNSSSIIIQQQQPRYNITGTIPQGGQGIAVGQYAEVKRCFNQKDVSDYARLIGDWNPLHFPKLETTTTTTENSTTTQTTLFDGRQVDEAQEMTTIMGDDDNNGNNLVIVHGMLCASLFSCIFGSVIPGSVYRSQKLTFNSAIFVNDVVVGQVMITRLKGVSRKDDGDSGVLCVCDTTVWKMGGEGDDDGGSKILCIQGEASVWLPGLKI